MLPTYVYKSRLAEGHGPPEEGNSTAAVTTIIAIMELVVCMRFLLLAPPCPMETADCTPMA